MTSTTRRVFERTLAASAAACDARQYLVTTQARVAKVFRARAVMCWILSNAFGWSSPKIGLYLCRDHSTVLAAIRRVNESTDMRRAAATAIDMMLEHSRSTHGDLTQ